MKSFIYALAGLLLCVSCQQQFSGKNTNVKAMAVAATDSLSFPESWVGDWEGTLEISNAKGVAQRIPMALELHPTREDSTFSWNIIYGPDREKGLRAYQLRIKNKEKGLYVVDEQNTIALESYLFGEKLYCWYLVAGNYILVIYEKKGEELHFGIVAGKGKPVSITGNAEHEGQMIPEVKTFPVTGVQHAVLIRKNK